MAHLINELLYQVALDGFLRKEPFCKIEIKLFRKAVSYTITQIVNVFFVLSDEYKKINIFLQEMESYMENFRILIDNYGNKGVSEIVNISYDYYLILQKIHKQQKIACLILQNEILTVMKNIFYYLYNVLDHVQTIYSK